VGFEVEATGVRVGLVEGTTVDGIMDGLNVGNFVGLALGSDVGNVGVRVGSYVGVNEIDGLIVS